MTVLKTEIPPEERQLDGELTPDELDKVVGGHNAFAQAVGEIASGNVLGGVVDLMKAAGEGGGSSGDKGTGFGGWFPS
jgi:hypothetical protein